MRVRNHKFEYEGYVYGSTRSLFKAWGVMIRYRPRGTKHFMKRQSKLFDTKEEAEAYLTVRLPQLKEASMTHGFDTADEANRYFARMLKKQKKEKRHGTSARTRKTSPSVRPRFESRPSKRPQPRVAEPALSQ